MGDFGVGETRGVGGDSIGGGERTRGGDDKGVVEEEEDCRLKGFEKARKTDFDFPFDVAGFGAID